MVKKIKVLIVEDEMIVARDIAYYLREMGCEIMKICIEGEQSLEYLAKNEVDIILMDITLKGRLNGVETVQRIKADHDTPVIYLTANTDNLSFQLAKTTKPYGFIEKPFKPKRLVRTVELLIEQIVERRSDNDDGSSQFILNDRIFVRENGEMKKIFIEDIILVEADGSYAKVITSSKQYILAINLLKLEERLSNDTFVRVHRSFLVNLKHVDGINDGFIKISNRSVPIGRKYHQAFMNKVKVI